MKYKMLVLILLLTVMSWAQSATPSASSPPQQSTIPADQAKCACCDKMSARDTKAGATCCAHHNMEAKDGKQMASDKDAMSCMKSSHDKAALLAAMMPAAKITAEKTRRISPLWRQLRQERDERLLLGSGGDRQKLRQRKAE